MAKAAATLETIKDILETRSENINQRTVVRFIPNDQVKLVVLDDKGNLDARGTGFSPKGGEEVLKYKFLLTRRGRTFPVFITLGAFTSLPIARGDLPLTLPRDSGKVQIMQSSRTSR